ncbi:MAG: carboxylesterase/lipase family protein, partial [Acidisphaera sp.]|nr:carboxylesterase/lipase family protein [Acidisphaera sp.]
MSETVRARCGLGELAGRREDGVVRFRAVPYAAPPVGERRFAPPAPPAPWAGVREAGTPGPIAPQPPSRLRAAMGEFSRPQSEDCLTVDIATPAADGALRPVLVWFHGGAFLSGAGSLDWYDGAALARAGDLVVVGVNYRLGPLGFLHWPGVADGTLGLQDAAAALGFVREHIAAFGGDPNAVTAMGQSAGGNAILRLLTMPHTEGLFRRAIIQSAPPRLGPGPERATANARRLATLLGIDPDAPDAAARLRQVPAEQLATLQMTVAREQAVFASMDPAFPPVSASPDFVEQAVAAMARRGVAVLSGTTREEMAAFFVADPAMATPDPARVAERFAAIAGSADAVAAWRRRRPGADLRDALVDLVTAQRFLLPTVDALERLAAAGRAGYLYQFDWAPPGSPWHACHCIELPFVFGTWGAWRAPMIAGGSDAAMRSLSDTMMAMW